MKISVNDEQLFALNETQKRVIQNDIASEVFDSDMKRRLEWVLMHKYERCFQRLKQEWEPKLSQRIAAIPTNPDEFAQLVFSQADYKNRSEREREKE